MNDAYQILAYAYADHVNLIGVDIRAIDSKADMLLRLLV